MVVVVIDKDNVEGEMSDLPSLFMTTVMRSKQAFPCTVRRTVLLGNIPLCCFSASTYINIHFRAKHA